MTAPSIKLLTYNFACPQCRMTAYFNKELPVFGYFEFQELDLDISDINSVCSNLQKRLPSFKSATILFLKSRF